RDRLLSNLSLIQDDNILNQPEDFQNNTTYQANDLYVKSKYQKTLGKVKLAAAAGLHQFSNRLKTNTISESENPFFINPRFSVAWEPTDTHKLTGGYTFSTTNAKILDVYDGFVLNGFRSFSKGTGDFNQLQNTNLNFNYDLGNWSSRFFNSFSFVYTRNHDFFSSNSVVQQNFVLNEKIRIKDSDMYFLNNTTDYYFKSISANLKVKLNYSQNDFKNIINDSDFRAVTSKNFGYGFELRSGFMGVFNFHFGSDWSNTRIESTFNNSFTNNVSFLDLSFIFSEKLNLKLQSERYYFGNLEDDKSFYFLDFDINYKLIKDKISLGISGRNLFNTKRFRSFSITDISTSTTEYRLLPRFVLMKANYRF
ncbi:MAG: TonB-dependent receptor, partial [Flavobacteriaceae bacterium]|nr:TonB-dependent receptor [Flavobacteriaceae bacterium]